MAGTASLAPRNRGKFYATSDDRYRFERLGGIKGWSAIHVPTGIELNWQTSLAAAYEYVNSGRAELDLERVQAHLRGDHAAVRVPACGRC